MLIKRIVSCSRVAAISRGSVGAVCSITRSTPIRHFSVVEATNWEPITNLLRHRSNQGELKLDQAQERAARRLARLQQALVNYSNEPFLLREEVENSDIKENDTLDIKENKPSHGKQLDDETSDAGIAAEDNDDKKKPAAPPLPRIPRGLFLHGHVGTGKSMLMDTFYHEIPMERKRRVHFHSFLQDVHKRIHALKQDDLRMRGRDFTINTSLDQNPIHRVAQKLAKEVTLLCFDEFQVTDVADALILKQLFETLFQHGVVMVATSNRPPSDLYEGGINRSYFLPFIDMLYQHCIVHQLESAVDYRTLLSTDLKDFFLVDNDADTLHQCEATFECLLQGEQAVSMELACGFNRSLTVRHAHPDGLVARFDFEELCSRELGSADYRAIAQQFDIVILKDIPLLTLENHDEARRFITLVDELYEHQCALFCSAVAYPKDLFAGAHVPSQETNSVETKVGEMFGIDVAQSSGKTVGELASVRELSFAFPRAASRLTQMCSRQWWDQVQSNRSN